MHLWSFPILPAFAALIGLIAAALLLPKVIPARARLVVPPAFAAGTAGLLLGPSAFDLLPVKTEVLEVAVYHSFAWMFIAVSLQAGRRGSVGSGASSMAMGVTIVAIVQSLIGFSFVAAWLALTSDALHPGFGWMVALGFVGGPGQALALGGAWEAHGLERGGQLGLVFAALGFACCLVLGVGLLAFGRRRGWISGEPVEPVDVPSAGGTEPPKRRTPLRYAGVVATQVAFMAAIYGVVFGVLLALGQLFGANSPIGSTFWGFHFLIGAGLALATRFAARRLGFEGVFDDDALAWISVVAVEVTTIAALSAVRFDLLGDLLAPILLLSGLAATLTLLGCLWFARRAFVERPFEHGLVLFGSSTGTLSTGLALLRATDPELRGPVARNAVVAATAAVPLGAPLFLVIVPLTVWLWPRGFAVVVVASVVLLLLDGLLMATLLPRLTRFRLLRPLRHIWPPDRTDGPAD